MLVIGLWIIKEKRITLRNPDTTPLQSALNQPENLTSHIPGLIFLRLPSESISFSQNQLPGNAHPPPEDRAGGTLAPRSGQRAALLNRKGFWKLLASLITLGYTGFHII